MIKSFECKDTEKLFSRVFVKRFSGFDRQARISLAVLNAAAVLADLRVPPSNRLEGLKGDRKGRFSIRINKQWRICFLCNQRGQSRLILSKSINQFTLAPLILKGRDHDKKLSPIHPGEVLKEEFMAPHTTSANALSKALKVPANRITAIVNGTRGITGDTALRLSAHFGTTAQFWMNLQSTYDLEQAEDLHGAEIRQDVALSA